MLKILKRLYGWFEGLVLLVLQSEMDAVCYQCGKQFTPGLDTPMPTRSWPYYFCSEIHKQDYIRSRE